MEVSRRVLKRAPSPPASDSRDANIMEIARHGSADKRHDSSSSSTGFPLDLSSRRSPPRTPPSGLTAATLPAGPPLSPCQGARPPSRPSVADERRPPTEAGPTAPAPTVPAAATPAYSPPDHANIAAAPIATQVTVGLKTSFYVFYSCHEGGSVAEWLACWTQAQKGPGSVRSRDAVG